MAPPILVKASADQSRRACSPHVCRGKKKLPGVSAKCLIFLVGDSTYGYHMVDANPAKSPTSCCVIGYCDTRAVGNGAGSTNSNGNAVVQTFAWGSRVPPGLYARSNGRVYWALQDIHALSHEIAEWADAPFVNNTVQPWLTPTAPQYGCTGGSWRPVIRWLASASTRRGTLHADGVT